MNSHGLGPTDFKSVMSTIPSRPHDWSVTGDSPANPMMQKESGVFYLKKSRCLVLVRNGGDLVIACKKLAAEDRADNSQKQGW